MQENSPSSIKPPSKATILVVDDSPTIRKLVSMTLESRGYCVVVACDGVDGLAKMQEGIPDLILSDISMPRLDGYQFCKVVKSNKETKHIPVIMLSGNDGLFDKVRGKMAGSANYITKPFEPNHLVKEIEKFVKTQKAPAAAPKQPSAAPQASATAGRGTVVKPVDAEAAQKISKKLSGIYIPTAMPLRSLGISTAMPGGTALPGEIDKKPTFGGEQPQAPAAKRPAPKLNDEPEIKIFYHNESAAAPPPEPAGVPSPTNKASSGDVPPQERALPSAVQPPTGAGSEIRAALNTSPQASKNIAPPVPGVQPASVRSTPPSAEARHTASPSAPRAAAPPQPGTIKASCPGCGTIYTNIKPEHIGKYARCKKCETRFLISQPCAR